METDFLFEYAQLCAVHALGAQTVFASFQLDGDECDLSLPPNLSWPAIPSTPSLHNPPPNIHQTLAQCHVPPGLASV